MKKQRKKRIVALAMSALMILSLTQNVVYTPYANVTEILQGSDEVASYTDAQEAIASSTDAQQEEDTLIEDQIEGYSEEPAALPFMDIVGKITLTPTSSASTPVDMSQQFTVKLEFDLPEDSVVDLSTNYIYYFDLNDIAVESQAGENVNALVASSSTTEPLPIVMGNVKVGTYTIEKGYVKLNFYEGLSTLVGDEDASRHGEFTFNCGLDEDKLSDDGGTYTLKFSTKEGVDNPTVTVNPKDTIDAGIDVAKSDATFDEANMTATYKITVTNNNNSVVNNVVIKDSMGTYLVFDENTITANNGAIVTPTKENQWSNNWNFSIADLQPGVTEITYTCAVDESVMIGANNALGSSYGLDNTVSAKVGDRNIYIDADNDTKSQTTTFSVYKDVVSKDVAVSGDTVTWTIVINAGSTALDLDGYTFTDTLDSGLMYDASSVTVTSTVPNDPNVAGLETAINGFENATEISYSFPAGSTGEYVITYTTTVPEHAGVVEYNNKAVVTNPDGEADKASKNTPGIGDSISSKAYDGTETDPTDPNDIPETMFDANGDLILDWKSTVYIPQNASSFTYYDYVKDEIWQNGLGFVEDSLVVTAKTNSGDVLTLEAGDDKDYTVQYTTNGTTYEMTVVLTSTGLAKVNQDGNTAVYLDYQTIGRYQDRTVNDWQKYMNNYTVTVGNITENGEASVEKYYQESKGSGGISKTAAVVDEDAHTITWQVTVDPGENNTLTNLKLVDTVTDMSYSGYSCGGYTYEYNSDDANAKMVAVIRTSNYAIYEIPMTQTNLGGSTEHPVYTYTIDFANATLTQLSSYGGFDNPAELDQKIDIFYTTKITGEYLLYNNYDTPYTNTVTATQKPLDQELTVGESTVTKTMDTEILTKECITEDGQPTSMLQYTININPDALNLNPSANYFVVEDDLPDSLVFMTDGTTVKDKDGNIYTYVNSAQQVKDAPLGTHIYHVSYMNGVIMFTVPDEAALSITYTVNMLMDSSSGYKQYINSVKIEEPYVANSSNNSSDVNRRISSSSATIYSILFKVEKVNSQDITQRLEGATFTLEEYAYIDGVGWSSTPTNTYTATTEAGKLLKDIDFEDANGNHPQTNHIYVLYESDSPYGYEKTDLQYKFIVLSDDGNGTWANRLNGMDDVYRIMGNSTFVFSNTPSTNVIPNKLTLTKEYYQADGITPVTELPNDKAIIQIFDKELSLQECQSGSYTPVSTGSISQQFVYTEVYNSTDGHKITLENIPNGTYTVYEKTAPEGYDILERVYTFVVDNGKVKWENDAEDYQVSATLENKQTYDNSITINKRYFKAADTLKANPLTTVPEDAEFICTNTATGQTVDVESVAGSEGFVYKMTKLPEGTYLLEEKSSTVYETDSLLPYTIEVSRLGNIAVRDKNGNSVDITLVDKDAEFTIDNIINDNSITINKKYYDADGNQITSTDGFDIATSQQKVNFTLYKDDGTGNYVEVTGTDNLYESYSDTANDTNCEDSYTWINLEPGKYKVVESLKTGDTTKYEPVADTYFTVGNDYKITVTNGSANVYDAEVNVNNKILSDSACRFYLTKQFSDQTGNLSLAESSDVTFILTESTWNSGNEVTGNDRALVYNATTKRWESTNLPDGNYTLTETATKDGYVSAETLTFTIENSQIVPSSISYSGDLADYSYVTESSGNIETIVFNLINRPEENSITINKAYYQPDEATVVTTTPNPGAKFTLYKVEAGVETEIDTLTGTTSYVFNKLEAGDYVIRETYVPDGYTEANPISFTVAENYEITVTSVSGDKSDVTVTSGTTGYEITINASNVLSNKFVITKQYTNVSDKLITGTDRETLFNNTTFTLYDEYDNPVTGTQFVQSANAVTITNLNDGTYTLKEEVSPEGFNQAGDITLVVLDGKITASYNGTSRSDFTDLYNNGTLNGSATLYNRQKENKLTITKYYNDADGNQLALTEVSNKASFSVKDASGNYVTTYTFNPNGGTYTFKNLAPGAYTITESAPIGFEPVPDYGFQVDLNGKITFDANVPTGWTVVTDSVLEASVHAFNQMKPNRLSLHKVFVDSDGNTKNVTITTDMEDMFTLEGIKGSETLEYDSATGLFYIDNIMPGTYELVEDVPSGYMPVTGKITVNVALDGTITATYTGGDAADFRITSAGTLVDANIEFKNHEVTNVITISKNYVTSTGDEIDVDTLEASEKADFKLYQNIGSSNKVEITDPDIVKKNADTGVYAFINLEAGYYTIEEVVGAGFEDNGQVITFRVNDDKEIISISGATATNDSTDFDKKFKIENKRMPFDNRLELTKEFINQGNESITGAEYTELIEDVEFAMFDSDDNKISGFEYNQTSGTWVVEQLEPGEYTIKETSYPDGYVPAGDVKVAVTKTAPGETEIAVNYLGNSSGDMTVSQDSTNMAEIAITLKNHQTVDNYFAIDKKYMDAFGNEIADSTELATLVADTEFVYRASNATTQTPIPYDETTGMYVLEDLQTGTYIITETAPADFVVLAQIELEVAADGRISVTYDGDANDISVANDPTKANATVLTAYNYHKSTNVNIGKYDIVSGDELPGAVLTITDEDGNVIDKWTSSTGVHKISLDLFEAGEEYVLTEITAPFGYEIAESITFKLDIYGNVYVLGEDGTFKIVDDNTVSMFDAHRFVNITKVDITNDKELPGAELTVKDEDGNVIDTWISTTDKHPISMSLFEPNKEYTLTEVTAPNGYEIAETITFKLDESGNIYIKGEDGNFTKLTDDSIVMKDAPVDNSVPGDEPEPEPTPGPEPTPEPPTDTSSSVTDSPDTGDNTKLLLMMVLMVMSIGAMMFFRKKKYN